MGKTSKGKTQVELAGSDVGEMRLYIRDTGPNFSADETNKPPYPRSAYTRIAVLKGHSQGKQVNS
jgi:hypothetical protein